MIKYRQILRRILQLHPETNSLFGEKINAAQEVRQFISMDLHDNVGPGLLIIRMYIEDLKMKAGNEHLSFLIGALSKTTDELLRNTQEMIWALHPNNDNLENAVNFISERFQCTADAASLTSNVVYPDFIPDISLPLALVRSLSLCAREATDFIIRNTAGTHLDLSIVITEEDIRIKIRDNNSESRLSQEEFSAVLKSIERKITAVNGTCSLFSALHGTTVWFKAPLVKFSTN